MPQEATSQPEILEKILAGAKSEFHSSVSLAFQQLTENASDEVIQAMKQLPEGDLWELGKIWSLSSFVAGYSSRHPDFLLSLFGSHSLLKDWAEQQCRDELAARVKACTTEDELASALRHFRHEMMCRIIWRDFSRRADMWLTTASMTWMADACIDIALDWLHNDCIAKWGSPMMTNEAGELVPQRLVVIGMGKLGAHELNVSSDIDLIFAYPENGETQGDGKTMENQRFFMRLGQRLISVLDKVTQDGFVFRVDMRLRPYGDSGSLALSFAAMEEYYQDQGRDWERYAMIKARVVAGDKIVGQQLMDALRPFVYRKYIDFSAFESLREMKMMIAREVRRKGLENNIKLGGGGIREIEFIAQAFQLIRGGRDTPLQAREIRTILHTLQEHQVLPEDAVKDLLSSYVFLRNLEHAIQGIDDKQTQLLPSDSIDQARVAEIMDLPDWESLMQTQQKYRDQVSRHFAEVISLEEDGEESSELDDHFPLIWEGRADEVEAIAFLKSSGYEAAEDSYKQLLSLRESKSVVVMQVQGRQRLDKFMPLLLSEVIQAPNPSETLARILKLVEAVIRRTAYLVLLYENPAALKQLVFLCSASPWIGEQLVQSPVLLDELLNQQSLYSPPNKETLADELRQQLLRVPEEDLEEQMEVLRHFKKAHVLRVAASELRGTLPLMKVSDYLTFIAETVLQQVLKIAWQGLVVKYGNPQKEPGVAADLGFAIVGYGKLGGIELGYTSDLDLVFVHDVNPSLSTDGDKSIDNAVFYTRLGQRIIHILSTQTVSGQLYEVDMRLRPSGNSGLLVASLKSFKQYQEKDAWTWEHQALVRSRAVAGSAEVSQKFEQIRQEIIRSPRDKDQLALEVRDMREKMRANLGTALVEGKPAEVFHTKHDPGGIVDVEFMVQYLALAFSSEHEFICRWSDNIRLLEECEKAGLISSHIEETMRNAYIALRSMIHKQALQNKSSKVSPDMFLEEREQIISAWRNVMSDPDWGGQFS